MMAKKAAGVVLAALLIATGTSTAQQSRIVAKTCTADDGYELALCRSYIAALRVFLQGQVVCSPVAGDDPSDTDAVIKWIRAHPERQQDDVGDVATEVLKKLHPCH